jgi:hypothetical protein
LADTLIFLNANESDCSSTRQPIRLFAPAQDARKQQLEKTGHGVEKHNLLRLCAPIAFVSGETDVLFERVTG